MNANLDSNRYLLDTNVLSEAMKQTCDPNVLAFLRSLDFTRTFISSVSVTELLYGIERMPSGRRRRQLETSLEKILNMFGDRILPFDLASSLHCAAMLATREQSGRPTGFANAQIAATAKTNACMVATRNTKDFEGMSISIVDPWHR
jgi:toxin FitB